MIISLAALLTAAAVAQPLGSAVGKPAQLWPCGQAAAPEAQAWALPPPGGSAGAVAQNGPAGLLLDASDKTVRLAKQKAGNAAQTWLWSRVNGTLQGGAGGGGSGQA